jgi:hypothetical protein
LPPFSKKIIIAAGLNQSQSAVAGSYISDYVIALGVQESNRLGHGDCSRKVAKSKFGMLLSCLAPLHLREMLRQ